MHHAVLAIVTVIAPFALSSCATGPRPTLGPATTIAPVTDDAILQMLDALARVPSTPFTVTYDITTKYGGETSTAEVSFDPNRGTAVLINQVLYVFPNVGGPSTCSWYEETLSAGGCSPGTDETRVSNLQLNSRVFKEAVVDRLVRDAQVTARPAESRQQTVAERDATCVDVPVIDGGGIERIKSYCVYPDLGIVASFDTGDLSVTAAFVDDVATGTMFEVSKADG